jgi:two-component system, cell cycle sensor histidine kinase and response regulator CckA
MGETFLFPAKLSDVAIDESSINEMERLRELCNAVRAAPMAVVGMDCADRVTLWNRAAEEIFGWKEKEILGTAGLVKTQEGSIEQFVSLERTLKGEVTRGLESVGVSKEGRRFPVSISAAPIRDGEGRLTGMVAIVEDISARKRIEQERSEKAIAQAEEQRKRLETEVRHAQKMEIMGQLSGGIAHDFNNMLMVLSGSTELLEKSLQAQSISKRYVEQIRRTVDKATAITKHLLAFSRKQVLNITPVDLHEVLTESEFMLPRLLGSDVQLTFRHEAARSWIRADAAQLEQVIANLAVNARDAMPEGGMLTISTRNAASLREGAVVTNGNGIGATEWVVLEVKDTGCGMDDETRTHIFEPFFTTKPSGKGTGLGLPTVYGIVHQFGGCIRVASQVNEGTRFEIYFPAQSPAEQTEAQFPRMSLGKGEAQALTILLVDDEPSLRSALAEYLRGAGHHVLEGQSAHDALELARSHEGAIDVLLTDIVMPGLRGTELANEVQKLHQEAHVIYISGNAQNLREAKIPKGAAFLQKPFRLATLAEQLKLVPRKV